MIDRFTRILQLFLQGLFIFKARFQLGDEGFQGVAAGVDLVLEGAFLELFDAVFEVIISFFQRLYVFLEVFNLFDYLQEDGGGLESVREVFYEEFGLFNLLFLLLVLEVRYVEGICGVFGFAFVVFGVLWLFLCCFLVFVVDYHLNFVKDIKTKWIKCKSITICRGK